jgi:predicted ester cyclase
VTNLDGYATLPDYILGITERIWEGRGVHLIRRWYSADCLVHTPSGPFIGAEAMVAGTLETLHAFPERDLLGEDVIWSDDGPSRGLLSSHRIVSQAAHEGAGFFGPASGRRVKMRAIADCLVREGVIVEEWLIRDNAGVVKQVGRDVAEHGRLLGAGDAAAKRAGWQRELVASVRRGEREPHAVDHPHEAARALKGGIEAAFNGADLAALRDLHDRAVALVLPGAIETHGTPALDRWVVGLLASFPDAHLVVDHSIALAEPARPVRAAARWRLAGTHTGHGAFGAPTGAEVLVMGITHAEFAGARVNRAWWLVDELAIHRQIGAHLG